MRILLTAPNGQVGFELRRTLSSLGEVVALDRRRLDLASPDSVRDAVREVKPDVVVNAGAYTAVDKAESEEPLAHAINATAPGILAEESARTGALLIHYSTDYVFDGRLDRPYREVDAVNPLSAYGRTKLEGERAVVGAGGAGLVFRTSWVYGSRGKNFLLTVQRLARERDELKVVSDQRGAPTWCRSLAEATAQVIAQYAVEPDRVRAKAGVYHLVCAGETSWHGFAEAIIARIADLARRPPVRAIPTSDYPTPAQRPLNSRLDCTQMRQAFAIALPDWRTALDLCLEEQV